MPAEPRTAETWDAMDAEIRSVFPREGADHPRPGAGKVSRRWKPRVLAGQRPTLAESRGKVAFLLYNKPLCSGLSRGSSASAGPRTFTNSEPGQPDAAFVERDKGEQDAIAALVKTGYIVRTRADFNTDQGRKNDRTRRDLTLASGAQMVSSDFPSQSRHLGPNTVLGFPVA